MELANNRRQTTLCFVRDDSQILLGLKKRGFGAGHWNGFGGKVMSGEGIELAAKRELLEESGIEVKGLRKAGIIDFDFADQTTQPIEMHVFDVTEWSGSPIETEEMLPQWFGLDKIPYDKMWEADSLWIPIFLKKINFRARFLFSKPSAAGDSAKVLENHIEIVN